MIRSVRALAALFVAAVSIVILPASSASAATTYDVSVGAFLPRVPGESMRFFPDTIDVHTGDTLHFTSDGFHTATLLPVGAGVVEWVQDNATLGSNQPYSPIEPDPDESPLTTKFGNAAIFPTDPTCGGAGQPACAFDGTSVLNSGAPLFAPLDFSVTVNVSAGNSFSVVCLVHGSTMRMRVNVVAGAASDPADIQAANAAALAQDADTADALYVQSRQGSTYAVVNGHRRWDVWAGIDNRHVALYGFFPAVLHLKKGDSIRWHFDSLIYEDHTVTFPKDTAKKIANTIVLACDPDGDTGPGPDVPPQLPDPPFCNDPSQLELHNDPRFFPVDGNGTVTGPKDLESSGVRGAGSALGDADYDLRFTAPSPTGGFRYICLIHPFMRGRVYVK